MVIGWPAGGGEILFHFRTWTWKDAEGHLVKADGESTIRNQRQEISKNKFSCYLLSPWIKYCLKLTSILLVAQNSKFL